MGRYGGCCVLEKGYDSRLLKQELVSVLRTVTDKEFIFNNPEGVVWFKSVYELVADDRANEEMGAAGSLRNSILDIRSKREALKKEILQLDEQEKEAVEAEGTRLCSL